MLRNNCDSSCLTVPLRVTHVITCITLCAALFVSCDLLSTRTPQPPDQQTTFRTPTTPDIVLQNFQSAINARDAVGYTRCFADSSRGPSAYRFIPAADAQSFAVRFQTWNVKDETSYFINLKSQVPAGASMAVILDSLRIEAGASDSTVYAANYTLVANHTVSDRPTEVRGRMHLTIKPDPITQLWSITQWIDVAIVSVPSWSILKARF